MLKKSLFTIIHFVFVVMLLTSAWMAYSSACNYEHQMDKFTEELHLMPKVKTTAKGILEWMTFKTYKGYTEEIEKLKAMEVEMNAAKQRSLVATILFFILSMGWLAFIYAFKRALFISSMLVISVIALAVGLFAPVLMIVSYKDFPILGAVVFQFQSKGIITAIQALFASDNYIVATIILVFSVLLPIVKTIVMGLALFTPVKFLASKSLHLIKLIGKWSMADVFVVALLLTYFSLSKDEFTNAEVQTGLYFFTGYVILSMIVSHLLTRFSSYK